MGADSRWPDSPTNPLTGRDEASPETGLQGPIQGHVWQGVGLRRHSCTLVLAWGCCCSLWEDE